MRKDTQMEKESFGAFIAQQRKEKNLTQKELAEKLMISDKAVSKWERGLSFPDITLLEPLADILSVTISELMEGRKIDMKDQFNADDLEKAVKTTLEMNKEEQNEENGRRLAERIVTAVCFTLLAALETAFLCFKFDIERLSMHLFTVEGLVVFFGIYFWVFVKDKIPSFYDENKVNFYSDGFFRMNIPGIYFNNSNWKHIVHAVRIWSICVSIGYPVLTFLEETFFPIEWWAVMFIVFIVVFSVMIPIYVCGKKYE